MSCIEILVAITLHLGLEGDYNNIHPHGRCNVDNNWDLEIGLVTGYSGADVAPMIRYINDGWFVAPAYETSGNIGLAIGYEFKLRGD